MDAVVMATTVTKSHATADTRKVCRLAQAMLAVVKTTVRNARITTGVRPPAITVPTATGTSTSRSIVTALFRAIAMASDEMGAIVAAVTTAGGSRMVDFPGNR